MKKTIYTILIIFSCLILFSNFTLKKTNYREVRNIQLTESLQQKIKFETKNLSKISIVNYCLNITSDLLYFNTVNGDLNNIKTIQNANCVGYSQFFSTITNYAFKVNNYKTRCKPVVGYVFLYNINLCKILSYIFSPTKYKNFVKDHDFVEIIDKDFIFYTDPCLYDILGNDFKS